VKYCRHGNGTGGNKRKSPRGRRESVSMICSAFSRGERSLAGDSLKSVIFYVREKRGGYYPLRSMFFGSVDRGRGGRSCFPVGGFGCTDSAVFFFGGFAGGKRGRGSSPHARKKLNYPAGAVNERKFQRKKERRFCLFGDKMAFSSKKTTAQS